MAGDSTDARHDSCANSDERDFGLCDSTAALVEMIAIDAGDSQKCIESIDGMTVFRFRGTVLPLVSLREELKPKAAAARDAGIVKLVVVRTEGGRSRCGSTPSGIQKKSPSSR